MKTPDISERRYMTLMHKHGFIQCGYLGYWVLPIPGDKVSSIVSDWNAGDRRRDKLAYMLKALDEALEQKG